MMLRELNLIEGIKFVHPKDVQDGKVELTENDITTNLPCDSRVGLVFVHHESEMDRLKAQEIGGKLIIDPKATSAARVVYDYYGGGGYRNAGTCQMDNDVVDRELPDIIAILNK